MVVDGDPLLGGGQRHVVTIEATEVAVVVTGYLDRGVGERLVDDILEPLTAEDAASPLGDTHRLRAVETAVPALVVEETPEQQLAQRTCTTVEEGVPAVHRLQVVVELLLAAALDGRQLSIAAAEVVQGEDVDIDPHQKRELLLFPECGMHVGYLGEGQVVAVITQ